MAIPERPVMTPRDEIRRRLERLAQPAGEGQPVDDVAQAAQRLVAGAQDLEAFVDRWEKRLSAMESATLDTTVKAMQRIENTVSQLVREAQVLAGVRWRREVMVFLCGAIFGATIGYCGVYIWRARDLAQDTHDVLEQILENNRRAQEAAKVPAPPKPARAR